MDKLDPHQLYSAISDHKLVISTDIDENQFSDAKEIYGQARNELKEALSKTEKGSDVYESINQALTDLKPEPKNAEELMENYNNALRDLGPLC